MGNLDGIRTFENAAESVRRRPTMYVGSLDDPLVPNRLLHEALCIPIDDAHFGCCTHVKIVLRTNGEAIVADNGPGLSLAVSNGQTKAESLLTELFACRDAKRDVERGKKLCHAGLVSLNALSIQCSLTVCRDGAEWRQDYVRGVPQHAFQRVNDTDHHGTTLHFRLDPDVLPHREFHLTELRDWLAENAGPLEVEIVDERADKTEGKSQG